jgi:hypothetical protein
MVSMHSWLAEQLMVLAMASPAACCQLLSIPRQLSAGPAVLCMCGVLMMCDSSDNARSCCPPAAAHQLLASNAQALPSAPEAGAPSSCTVCQQNSCRAKQLHGCLLLLPAGCLLHPEPSHVCQPVKVWPQAL